MLLSKKLFMYPWRLPVSRPLPPEDSTLTLVAESTNSAQYYTVPEDGWYKVQIGAGNGSTTHTAGGTGGRASHTFFMFKGTRCLIWRGLNAASGWKDYAGRGTTYYPQPVGNGQGSANNGPGGSGPAGGGGAFFGARGGGGGGSATGHGGNSGYNAGGAGAGSGFIAVMDTDGQTQTESWNHAGFGGDTVVCMVLAGGGGGGIGDSADRSGGAGGGAWGNGGGTYGVSGVGTGPGGSTFGVGQSTVRYGAGGDGAWCVRDFSTGTMTWGTGAKDTSFGSAAARLYRYDTQEPLKPIPTITYTEPLEVTTPRQEGYRILLQPGQYFFSTKSTNGGDEDKTLYTISNPTAFNIVFPPFGNSSITPDVPDAAVLVSSEGTATSARDGFFKIVEITPATEFEDWGNIDDEPTEEQDWGSLDGTITEEQDWGNVV